MNKRKLIFQKFSDDQLVQLIKQNNYSLFELEEITGVNHKKLKEKLINKLGDKIEFKRGRNGGIFIKD